MLEILLIIYLGRKLDETAVAKGHKKGVYKTLIWLYWFGAEFLGFILGIALIGPDNILALAVIGLLFGGGGYMLLHYRVSNLPDVSKPAEPVEETRPDSFS